jgi:hypothetical protein
MTDESANPGGLAAGAAGLPAALGRATFQAELDALRAREKPHTRQGDAIAAARRRLTMVEVDPSLTVTGPHGPLTLLEAFEGRRQLIAYYVMWDPGHPSAEQCEGCTFYTTQVGELSYVHSRDITYAVFCQGPYGESARYRAFMGWDMPWYSAQPSLGALLAGRPIGLSTWCATCAMAAAASRPAGPPPRCPGYGSQLRADGPVGVRVPGDLGGLTPGWPQQCTTRGPPAARV